MSFATLALVGAVALLGPLLALPYRWYMPVVLGELAAGIVAGPTVLGVLEPHEPTFTFLANLGFALVMFVAGSRVPVRDPRLRPALRAGTLRAAAVGVIAVPVAWVVAALFHTGHPGLYAVLIASSSAALVLPIVDSARLAGPAVLQVLPQVAVADTACIVALPLVIDPGKAVPAAVGSCAVLACAGLLFVVLRRLEVAGLRKRLHRLSERRKFALELRISLVILFALVTLALAVHSSVLLAGFSFGLVVAGVGEPRRVARQLFALSDGFLGPLFFVWLGASLDLGGLGSRPSVWLLGLALGAAAVAVHAAMSAGGQPLAFSVLAAAQMGVPVAAATLGTQLDLLAPGESTAFILGALITVGAAALGGGVAARTAHRGLTDPPSDPPRPGGQ